ncbi:MAG: Re/Si-specific NAD(P)(+) transhydrogenase subunit alpha [Gammaproteobacteria bacterium]
MPINIVIPKERQSGESRVAMVPALVNRLTALGLDVKVEQGAGEGIHSADSSYKGATIVPKASELYAEGDIVIKVLAPTLEEVGQMKNGAVLISFLYPHLCPEVVKALAAKNITSFAMESIPRISRAQDMDALSSQATISGYKAVLLAANEAKFFFPMLTTAAGSIRPCKVLIIGVGVAGLQAIATARRLGAIVEAYDVRPETKEQVQSLGAKFVDVGVQAAGEGGYARELTEEEKQKQRAVLLKHVAGSDVVITTAGVPGKAAPKIIFKDMLEAMKPGSVVIDIMAEMGGNCELVKAGEKVVHNGVSIVGTKNIYSSLANPASEMYARNILNLLNLIIKENKLNLDWNDEVVVGSVVTRDGKIVK